MASSFVVDMMQFLDCIPSGQGRNRKPHGRNRKNAGLDLARGVLSHVA